STKVARLQAEAAEQRYPREQLGGGDADISCRCRELPFGLPDVRAPAQQIRSKARRDLDAGLGQWPRNAKAIVERLGRLTGQQRKAKGGRGRVAFEAGNLRGGPARLSLGARSVEAGCDPDTQTVRDEADD